MRGTYLPITFSDVENVLDSIFSFNEAYTELRSDTKETDSDYIVRAEVPGLTKDDITITFEDKLLKLEASWKKSDSNIRREGSYKLFKSFPNVDGEKIEAKLNDGILILTLPKIEAAKPKQIAIN